MATIVDARLVAVRSRAFLAELADGERLEVVVPKRLRHENPAWVDPVAVGDRVRIEIRGEDRVIAEVLPRHNALSRPASGRRGRRQMLVANLDVGVVVLAARSPEWKPATLDRYLVLLSSGDVPPAFCLNKIDLAPGERESEALAPYRELGLPLFFTSAETGEGVEELRGFLRGKAAALVGSSGVGKSSLINALDPEAGLRVGEVSERTDKGTHTTTWVEAIPLASGGELIDSPGIRVLDLSGVEADDLDRHFPEFAEPAARCRFNDCRHAAEPGCGVKEAVAAGEIHPARYDSYLRIRESLRAGMG